MKKKKKNWLLYAVIINWNSSMKSYLWLVFSFIFLILVVFFITTWIVISMTVRNSLSETITISHWDSYSLFALGLLSYLYQLLYPLSYKSNWYNKSLNWTYKTIWYLSLISCICCCLFTLVVLIAYFIYFYLSIFKFIFIYQLIHFGFLWEKRIIQ